MCINLLNPLPSIEIPESAPLQITQITLPALRNQAWVWPEKQPRRPILSFWGPAEFYELHLRATEFCFSSRQSCSCITFCRLDYIRIVDQGRSEYYPFMNNHTFVTSAAVLSLRCVLPAVTTVTTAVYSCMSLLCFFLPGGLAAHDMLPFAFNSMCFRLTFA